MAYQLEYAYTSHTGNVRANNEDNFWCCGETMGAFNQGTGGIRTGRTAQSDYPLFAVFDGMGGESCGEMAAYLAADACGRHYRENRSSLKEQPEQFLEDICRDMNRAVCEYSQENRIRIMGTTTVMLTVSEGVLYACNVGDSRLYEVKKRTGNTAGDFQQISTDHVLRGGPFGKAPLTQYVGIPEDHMGIEPSVLKLEMQPGMRYLLCSDGVTDMLSDKELEDILSKEIPVQEVVEMLLNSSLERGGRDNVTIILCEIIEEDHRPRLLRWFENRHKKEILQKTDR